MKFRLTLLLLFVCFHAHADYGYMPLSYLITQVNYGVAGTIVKLDNNYFYLRVDSTILGKIDEDTIPIIRFKDWNCGRRYTAYKVGQQEIVFFNKTNNDIPEFDYKGVGGGCEFELTVGRDSIAYHCSYGGYIRYPRSGFANVVKEYKQFIDSFQVKSRKLDSNSWRKFSARSALHKKLNENNPLLWPNYREFDQREEKSKKMLGKIPEPTIYIDGIKGDSVSISYIKHIRLELKHDLGGYLIDEHLKYKVLRFDVDVIHNGTTKTMTSKNEYGNEDMNTLVRLVEPGDRVRYYNILCKYPDGKIVAVKEKTVYATAKVY
ncbi:MAG: hypothetical protein EOP51_00125 [Sphingobacteriales bacterium]|nr:MAG: hypothetical protein EOP51_00125 [Sphingobacteriales bacterium]